MATLPRPQSTWEASTRKISPPSDLPPEVEGKSLAQAFATFGRAAISLEHSYSQLQSEVTRLRGELEETNRGLSCSLKENQRIRLRLNRILEGLPCGVLVVAGERVSLSNPESRRILGLTGDGEIPAAILELLERIEGGCAEFEWPSRPGNRRWISIRRAQLSPDESSGLIFIFEDITARKEFELERANFSRCRALADMSGMLAHEIRNPLGSLELFAGLLAESDMSDDQREWIGQLQAGLRTLTATVNNVLHFHTQAQTALTGVPLRELVATVVQFLRPLANRANVRIEAQLTGEEILVAGDRHRLEQVLLNLALNSFHFMPAGGEWRIAVGRWAAKFVRMEVSDTGSGIAPANRGRIFEPGFTTRPGSPGLGLAVCKKIMEQHNGAICVADRVGGGTRFILEFPVLEEHHA